MKNECISFVLQIGSVKKLLVLVIVRDFQKRPLTPLDSLPRQLQIRSWDADIVTDQDTLMPIVDRKQWKDHHLCLIGSPKLNVKDARRKDTYLSTALQDMITNLSNPKMSKDIINITIRKLQMSVNLLEWLVTILHVVGHAQINRQRARNQSTISIHKIIILALIISRIYICLNLTNKNPGTI